VTVAQIGDVFVEQIVEHLPQMQSNALNSVHFPLAKLLKARRTGVFRGLWDRRSSHLSYAATFCYNNLIMNWLRLHASCRILTQGEPRPSTRLVTSTRRTAPSMFNIMSQKL